MGGDNDVNIFSGMWSDNRSDMYSSDTHSEFIVSWQYSSDRALCYHRDALLIRALNVGDQKGRTVVLSGVTGCAH
jgi:hypothetical protein